MSTVVVCAAFDAATDAAIDVVREQVRAAGISLPDRPRHRAHISLAAARVAAEVPEVLAVATRLAAAQAPIDLLLDEVGRFSRAGVVWLGPSGSPQLRSLQRAVADALADGGWPSAFGERSGPDRWVPHCTLVTRVPEPKVREVQARIRRHYQPIRARVDALATILVGGRGDIGYAQLQSGSL